tara:strand:+ start:1727 stop:2371 length:645 start_codon:yes stop_codon:yes gene_type:complete
MKNINLRIKPYSLWLSYNILNQNVIQNMLPPGMELANIRVSDDNDCVKPKLLFNCYSIDSFWMRGSRLEIMTIAKHENNFHFVVLECISNTLQWDPINRINGPNGKIKFNYIQEKINYDIISKNNKVLKFTGTPLNLIKMTEDFAVKSNYVCFFRESSIPISLKFNEKEIMKPVRKLEVLNVTNDFWKDYREETPEHVFMHEHCMNFATIMPFI